MNDILRLAGSEETSILCPRCLGRLFGKLGHNLDNPTRGKALTLLVHINKIRDQNIKNDNTNALLKSPKNLKLIDKLMNDFDFSETYMTALCGALGLEYDIDSSSDSKALEELIRALVPKKYLRSLAGNNGYCEFCDRLFKELPKFSKIICDSVKDYEFNDFLIGCKLDYDLVTREEELWSKLGITHAEPLKTEFNRELGKVVEPQLEKSVNFDTPDITILVDTRYDNISLQIASLFIYGRYRKLIRGIPQTRWPCKRCWGKGCKNCDGTGKVYQTSVEELIAERVMKMTEGKKHLFHGMGREDIEVRMLGNGRPFVLEITEPRLRNLDLTTIEKEVNKYTKDKVEVSGLRFSTNQEVRQIKAAKPSKTYKIKINFENSLNEAKVKDIVSTFSGQIIKQRTPIRVSHRRTDLVRERKVHLMALDTLSDNGRAAEVEITGESGLYIKELIHGDAGRTMPNLAEKLNTTCTVLALDVIRINDD
ncbi:tRNA pseudouridine(54/55) synthase Pus10 [[Eubacterium] cellulosolvens]